MNKNLRLLSLLFIISSCESQLGTSIQGAFTNVLSGNFGFSSSGNEAYTKMKKEYLSNPNLNLNTPTCTVVDEINPIININTENISKIKDELCSCSAWGSCDAKSCSCEKLCPNDFSIFKRLDNTAMESSENTLSFTNAANKFSDGITYQGYCWGFALLTQRFNRMANFSPASPKKFTTINEDSSRINFYKDIIRRVNNNEVVDIPGFSNLQDFSEDPEVKDLLEDSVKDLWSENAMSMQGLGMVASSRTPKKNDLNKMFDDIEFRLKNNLSPAIVYNLADSQTSAHTLLVSGSGVNSNTGERYLCLRDNQYQAKDSLNCNIKMIIKSDGTLIREYGGGLLVDSKTKRPIEPLIVGKVELAHSENTNTIEQISNLRDKCKNDKNCNSN
jgi:hypothetical protein